MVISCFQPGRMSRFLDTLLISGGGFLSSRLLFDALVLLPVVYFIVKVLVPVFRQYRLALNLDRICGSEPRHWFYGHMKTVIHWLLR